MPEHPTHHGYQIHLADTVYEPAEDSYLLIDAARGGIVGSNQRLRIIEIGTGSGIVTTAMNRLFVFRYNILPTFLFVVILNVRPPLYCEVGGRGFGRLS